MRIENLFDLHCQFPDIDGYWDFNHLSLTEESIRKLLPAEEGEWTLKNFEEASQLARLQGLKEQYPEARATLRTIEKKIGSFPADQSIRLQTRYYLESGRVHSLSRSAFKAQELFAKAWTLSKNHNLIYFAIDAAVMMAISQPIKRRYEWLEQALSLAEASSSQQDQMWLAQLYSMNAWALFDLRRFDEALAFFEKALSKTDASENKSSTDGLRWSVARTLRQLARVPEAYEVQLGLLREQSARGKVNGHVSLELGECLQALEKHEEARAYFETAHKELSTDEWFTNNKPEELARILYLWKRRT
jgi:tetratricopeptide (TPR) repeat protein